MSLPATKTSTDIDYAVEKILFVAYIVLNYFLFIFTENLTKLTLKVTDYVNIIDPDSHVNVYVIANVKETNQKYINRDIIRCERPNLELKVGNTT